MANNGQTQFFDGLRRYARLSGVILTKEANNRVSITSYIFLLGAYAYCALYFPRKWSLDNDIKDLIYAAGIANCAPRSTILRIYRSKLIDLLVSLEQSAYKAYRASELSREIEKGTSKVGHIIFPLLGIFIVVTILPWYLLHSHGSLPFGSMPVWAMNYSSTGCLALQVTVFTFLCLEYVVMDTIKLSIMIHLRIHFKYLKLSVQDLIENAKEEFCTENQLERLVHQHDIPFVYFQKQLKKVVEHYNYIIQVASETELIFNKCVLASFINMSFSSCLAMLRISNMQQFSTEHLQLLYYIVGPLVLFFVDCYFTQEVITENEAFAYSFYDIDFIGTNLAFQKCLILCIARTQRSVSFTIGKFAPLTMVASVTILKAAFSYYTLLESRQKK